MNLSEQFKLLTEKFKADMAAGMTAGQAKTDILAYMKNAGITGFGASSFLSNIIPVLSAGMTRGTALVSGMRGAGTAAQAGSFLFGAVTAAKSTTDLLDALKNLNDQMGKTKDSVSLTEETFTGYNSEVRKQNAELANLNDSLFTQNVLNRNLVSGTKEYSSAVERIIIANKLFADGVITTVQQLNLAAANATGSDAFTQIGQILPMVQSAVTQLFQERDSAAEAARSAAAAQTKEQKAAAAGKKATGYTKKEIQDHINSQKTLVDTLQQQIEKNNTLRQQAQAAAESNKEVQSAQSSLDEAVASGNLLRISAAQANLEETKNRIANTKHFDSVQSRLQNRVTTAQTQIDTWTTKMEKWQTAADQATSNTTSAATAGVEAVSGVTDTAVGAFETLLTKSKNVKGSTSSWLRSLGKNNPEASSALETLQSSGLKIDSIASKLDEIRSKDPWKKLVTDTKAVGDNLERINSLVGLATSTAATAAIGDLTKKTDAKAQAKNRTTLATVAGGLGSGATPEAIGGLLESKFGKGKYAEAAKSFGITKKISSYAQLASAVLGSSIGAEGYSSKVVWDKDNKTPVDLSLMPYIDGGLFETKYNADTKTRILQTQDYDGSAIPKFTSAGLSAVKAGNFDDFLLDKNVNPFLAKTDEYFKVETIAAHTTTNTTGRGAGTYTIPASGSWNKYNADGTRNSGGKGYLSLYAQGGPVYGPGTGTSDSIPARLSHGEYVINAKAAQKMGIKYLDMINQGMLLTPTFGSINSRGGNVNNVGTMNNTVYNINVNVAGSNASPDDIANTVLKTIERKQQTLYSNRRII